ncbi:hypothetical protein [Hymenobacter lapidiphilus]|uniref:Protein BatD n=1 Tax=Hymenobacter lapidiphilus TaxID=2608003 RepID=A0A7Y7PLP3_9BACT|nr:hypothetical protein [Hymenobacter lapidiphilus]NVO30129.1 hypothetical protein [Hymenobacter lapidiphilus]
MLLLLAGAGVAQVPASATATAVADTPATAAPAAAPAATLAQPEAVAQGRFRKAAVRVGEIIEYELTSDHAPALEIIFPDSAASFAPFEYVGRRYRPTRTRQGRSLDQAVYRLRTFSLDSVQTLSVPITVLRGRDTLVVPTQPVQVRLMRTAPVVAAAAEPPALRQNLQLLPVAQRFNYPYWLAGLAGLLLLAGGLVLGFRQRLHLRYRRYRLRKNHAYFLAQYARHVERFTLSRSLNNMERAITLWKNYLSTLTNFNITSLTTREIVARYHHDPAVRQALMLADRVIYGNQFSEEDAETDPIFDLLRQFAERQYALVMTREGE